MAAPVSSSLAVAVAHAVNFLTAPLSSYPATTVVKLQIVLEANLIALYQPTWTPHDPSRGSGRRCLSLSPACLPPRPIYAACIAAGVQWFDWIAALGGCEFDLLVNPGAVGARLGKKGTPSFQLITIWVEDVPACPFPKAFTTPELTEAHIQAQIQSQAAARSKTLAQQILEDDTEEDDQLFAMIADEVSAPSWVTPTIEKFPVSSRSDTPLSFISGHSRSSSRSSNSSSGFSFVSGNSSLTSLSSTSSPEKPAVKQSRRERARQARVFIDASKNEVTPYDGGKTTVLTGGVMLGGAPKAKKAPRPTQPSNWRGAHA